MKRLFIAIAIALSLASCDGGKTLRDFATIGVDNPISVQQLAAIEQSYLTVLRPTVAYLETRTCRNSEDELSSWITASPCGQYARKVVVQDALRSAQKYRRQLSSFVKQNRTIDARVAMTELSKAIDIMGAVPKKAGS